MMVTLKVKLREILEDLYFEGQGVYSMCDESCDKTLSQILSAVRELVPEANGDKVVMTCEYQEAWNACRAEMMEKLED